MRPLPVEHAVFEAACPGGATPLSNASKLKTGRLSAQAVAAGSLRLGLPQIDEGWIYWLEARPLEGGRQQVMRCRVGGVPEAVSAATVNVRTRVHEYGGGDYHVDRGRFFYVDFDDQRLYCDGRVLSPPGRRYADMAVSPDRRWLVLVEERPREGREPENRIAGFDLAQDNPTPRVVAGGHDFVSSPRFSPRGDELAFIAWNHPNMPWDATQLQVLAWGARGPAGEARREAGGDRESILEPRYSPAGVLTFTSDRSGWWNLYQRGREARALCPRKAEFAGPPWIFGLSHYDFIDESHILCSRREVEGDRLAVLDLVSGALDPLPLPLTEIGGIHVEGNRACFVAAGPRTPLGVYALDLETRETHCLRTSAMPDADPDALSLAEAIEFPGSGGHPTHAFFYPARGPARKGAAPLLVKSHGGPTSQATSSLDLRIQYWTQRGFAVVDVNYGGSTGYGRAYRERLTETWGQVDVEDCIAAAQSLVAAGRADGARLAITGGSAGGFTTLCALTFHDVFAAGASHYGIGDLEALLRDTHKFESRYLDGLVGPYPEMKARYRERSPIHHTDQLSCPVIFFQGLEDRVVPPAQAEAMVAALARRGLPHAYVPFEGEQHGFRRAENMAAALDGEWVFYARVFGLAVG